MKDVAHMVFKFNNIIINLDGPDTFSKNGKIFGEFSNRVIDLVN